MESQSDEENVVHPIVSNLLGRKFTQRTGQVLRYDREMMMRLSTAPLSLQRPAYLSVEFNGDDGKFSPFKWLEHRWEIEGIKNRAPTKKLQDALSAGAVDDNAGLSPQRRGFSGGCRAPADDKGKDGLPSGSGFGSEGGYAGAEKERDRLGSTNSKSWRSGSNGSADKYFGKGNDFKLPFQKSSGANTRGGNSNSNSSGSWRTEMKDRGSSLGTGKYTQNRNQRDERDRGERIPEWADGSTTMDDMIELRGFEEPIKKSKKGAASRGKDEKERDKEKDKKGDARKESLENGRLDHHHVLENETTSAPRPLGSVLPESDAELAAILGLLDVQDEGGASSFVDKVCIGDSSSSATATGSRLSRFFKNSNKTDNALQDIRNPQDDTQSASPLLAKIFAQNPLPASQIPQNVQGNPSMLLSGAGASGTRAVRLEDLEKAFSSKDPRSGSTTKDNSIQDPNQQALFLSRLQNFVKQQEENPHLTPGGPSMPNPGLAPTVWPAENPALMQAHIQAQLHQALAAQLAANGGVNVPPVHMQEQVRAALMRLQQQQLVAAAAATQGKMGKVRPPTQMIPSSVQRQMTKASSSQHEETIHRNLRSEQDGSPPHMNDAEALEAAARSNADMLKKMQMQHQYAAMMNAMQGGLPMAAWRPPPPSNSGVPPNPQAQAQLLMQMAQMQQYAQAQQRMRMKQQQQAAIAKIMQLQGHQQAAAAATSVQVPSVSERSLQNFGPGSPFGAAGDLSGPIQSPLEKLLAAAGVQPAQFTGANHESNTPFQGTSQSVAHVGARMPPPSVRPMSLEELERKLTEQTK
ncbi:hypothetical protein KIN20_015284 [Parelaphostrongylus tenuis]|uniref:Uncharacterized protein n=1 Tax=Parelaphostrongylus tenuis TaxID=148309 RepID=A0AAD5MYA3_PARTN|nr:hypothetical protein KIN20_015284 [Parelaphostrongylus tenuis]